jgi:hypothetical protein
MRSPCPMSQLPSRCGSLIRPFQPTLLRGFSRYTRITINSSGRCRSMTDTRRSAYSSAASGSWIEQGPTTHSRRSSFACTMSMACARKERIEPAASEERARRAFNWATVGTAPEPLTGRLVLTSSELIFGAPTERDISFPGGVGPGWRAADLDWVRGRNSGKDKSKKPPVETTEGGGWCECLMGSSYNGPWPPRRGSANN